MKFCGSGLLILAVLTSSLFAAGSLTPDPVGDFSYTESSYVDSSTGETIFQRHLNNWDVSKDGSPFDLGFGLNVSEYEFMTFVEDELAFFSSEDGYSEYDDDGQLLLTTTFNITESQAGYYKIGVWADWDSKKSESDFFYGFIDGVTSPNDSYLLWTNNNAPKYSGYSEGSFGEELETHRSFYLAAGTHDLSLLIDYDGYNNTIPEYYTYMNIYDVYLNQANTPSPDPVPAPGAVLLAGLGTACAGYWRRRVL